MSEDSSRFIQKKNAYEMGYYDGLREGIKAANDQTKIIVSHILSELYRDLQLHKEKSACEVLRKFYKDWNGHQIICYPSDDAIPVQYIQKKAEEFRRDGEAKLLQCPLIQAETLENLIDDWKLRVNRGKQNE